MTERNKGLRVSILFGIVLSVLYLFFIPNIETGFSCKFCDFETYRNDWLNDFSYKMPAWDGNAPYPDGYFTFEEIKQRFYYTLCLKVLLVGFSSSIIMFYFLTKLRLK